MKCFRLNRRRTVAVLLLIPIVPTLLWGLVIAVAPTEWARARLVAEVEGVTGKSATIGSIHLGLTGHLRLGDVTLAETTTPTDPWLKAAEVRLDVHLIQMVLGCCTPKEIAIDGLDLRVHRRGDGTLEFASLLGSSTEPTSATEARTTGSARVDLTLANARVVVIDDPSTTRIELFEAEGKATYTGDLLVVESLKGRLNGGLVEFAARYDRSQPSPAFEAELRARGVTLGVGMKSLGVLVPVVTNVNDSVDGRLDLSLVLNGQGNSLGSIRPSLKGHGAIRLDPIDLSGSKIIDSIEAMKRIPQSSQVGSVESHFAIEGSRVTTDDLTIKVARLPITLVGWTDFEGRIDYAIKSSSLRERFAGKIPVEAQGLIGDLQQDLGDLASIRITGTVDNPRLVGGHAGKEIDKTRLRDTARKLGERYLR